MKYCRMQFDSTWKYKTFLWCDEFAIGIKNEIIVISKESNTFTIALLYRTIRTIVEN